MIFCIENIGGRLPLHYYNQLNEHLKRDEPHEGGGAAFYNQEVSNPNSANRTCAWPVVVRSAMVQSDQEEVLELVISTMEKFQWEAMEIANYLKVRWTDDVNKGYNANGYL